VLWYIAPEVAEGNLVLLMVLASLLGLVVISSRDMLIGGTNKHFLPESYVGLALEVLSKETKSSNSSTLWLVVVGVTLMVSICWMHLIEQLFTLFVLLRILFHKKVGNKRVVR
jgi:uncharacterized BrkB/YihY/UPF0761 family membrane protein